MSNLDSQIALAHKALLKFATKLKDQSTTLLEPSYHEEGSLRYHYGDGGENISCKVKLAGFQSLSR